jgi:hypothetical protein
VGYRHDGHEHLQNLASRRGGGDGDADRFQPRWTGQGLLAKGAANVAPLPIRGLARAREWSTRWSSPARNHTHRTVLEPLFDAGLTILCEKPLADDVDDARWIVDARRPIARRVLDGDGIPLHAAAARCSSSRSTAAASAISRCCRSASIASRSCTKVGDWNRFSANTGGTMC